MKIITVILIIISILFSTADNVSADTFVVGNSAQLKRDHVNKDFDYRVVSLKNYLKKHNSPLTDSAGDFVSYADKYNLDWRLVASISGVESTFGKRIPSNSYNAYGWNNGNYYFNSWPESIEHVSKALREKYINDGLTSINDVGTRYAVSPDWAWKVKYFMNDIERIPMEFTI